MPLSYTYDPTTHKWGTTTTSAGGEDKTTTKQKDTKQEDTSTTGGDNLGASTSDPSSAAGQTDQQSNYIEIRTLEGTLVFIVTEDTIKIKAGDTIELKGIGKYLSGNYYVKTMTRQISNNGYAHEAVVIKTDFGESLKSSTASNRGSTRVSGNVISNKNTVPVASKPQSSVAGNKTTVKTIPVKKGDTVLSIAKKAVGGVGILSVVGATVGAKVGAIPKISGLVKDIKTINTNAIVKGATIAVGVSPLKVGSTVAVPVSSISKVAITPKKRDKLKKK